MALAFSASVASALATQHFGHASGGGGQLRCFRPALDFHTNGRFAQFFQVIHDASGTSSAPTSCVLEIADGFDGKGRRDLFPVDHNRGADAANRRVARYAHRLAARAINRDGDSALAERSSLTTCNKS